MPSASTLTDLFACPRCDKSPLAAAGDGHRCAACKTEFPSIEGIPWLFAHPAGALGEWRNRLHFELQRLAIETERLQAELRDEALRPLTCRRLQLERDAYEEHGKALRQLLAPLDLQALQGSFDSHLALRTRLPLEQGLYTYYANVHRDWAWGRDENEAALEQIRAVVTDGEDFGDLLVAGAGACRLAYDLHMQFGPERTAALDFNPLLILVGDRVARGEPLELHEFPIAPKSLEQVAVLRRLQAPEPVSEGFYPVLGDVLRAPFRPAAFDTVVTPWLIDVIAEDLPVLAARVNRLLRDGGQWINTGSLAFERPAHARRYGPEETLAIVEEAGFGAAAVNEAVVPYMCSPASRHGRREQVFTFAVTKMSEAKAPPRHKALPDWLVTGKEPVPLLPSFRTQAMSTRIYAYVMSLIDGHRSIEDMATLMEREKLMPRAEAVPAIRGFFTRMYDDSRKI
jgi:uncharacterized protein YbaR (Trm112 family)